MNPCPSHSADTHPRAQKELKSVGIWRVVDVPVAGFVFVNAFGLPQPHNAGMPVRVDQPVLVMVRLVQNDADEDDR